VIEAAQGLLVPLCFSVGLAIGSFLNVVIWRVPRGVSVVTPGSACPACGVQIRGYDNIPVVSWLVLRARCRDCGARISARYPAVEMGTGVAFGLVAWWIGASWTLPVLLLLVALTVALSAIDLELHRLPDPIVLPAYPVAIALLALASWAPGAESDWFALMRAGIGGSTMFVAYFAMRIVYPRGMGFGDVKLAGLLGLVLGWWGPSALVVGFFAAFLLGGIWAVALMLLGRAGRGSKVPFAPWMLAGAWIGLGFGEALGAAYLRLIGL